MDIQSKGDFVLNEGDMIGFCSSGAGGYGDPLKRKPEAVLRDVLDGRVSLKAAADEYGVVIDEKSMTIDTERPRNYGKKKPDKGVLSPGPMTRAPMVEASPNSEHRWNKGEVNYGDSLWVSISVEHSRI